MSENVTNRRAWLGIIILVIGATFLLRNLGFLPREIELFFGWEMFFILLGIVLLVSGKNGGIVFIIIGGIFLLQEFTHFYFRMRDWWPVILIIIGVFLLLKQSGRGSGGSGRRVSGQTDDSDSFDDVNVFGGGTKNITSKNFTGGRVTSVFGGADINFGDSLPSPAHAVIDLFIMFGGCTLYVPSDWTVRLEQFSLFGGFSDNRRNVKADANKVLVVKGLVLFGGGEVKAA